MSDLKEEIKKAVSDYYFYINDIQLATIKPGMVGVWVNDKRFGNYDIKNHQFVDFEKSNKY